MKKIILDVLNGYKEPFDKDDKDIKLLAIFSEQFDDIANEIVKNLSLPSIIESIYSEIETRILEARKDECWNEVDIADKYGVIDGLKQAKFIVDEHKSKYSL